mgnify:CR=1 FL=1
MMIQSSMGRKAQNVRGRMNDKLKRLKHALIHQKTVSGKQSQNYQRAAEAWAQEANIFKAKRRETRRLQEEELCLEVSQRFKISGSL